MNLKEFQRLRAFQYAKSNAPWTTNKGRRHVKCLAKKATGRKDLLYGAIVSEPVTIWHDRNNRKEIIR